MLKFLCQTSYFEFQKCTNQQNATSYLTLDFKKFNIRYTNPHTVKSCIITTREWMDIVFLQHFGFLHKKALLQSSNRITNMFFAQRVLCESRGLLTKQRSGLIICILSCLIEVLNYKLITNVHKWNIKHDELRSRAS